MGDPKYSIVSEKRKVSVSKIEYNKGGQSEIVIKGVADFLAFGSWSDGHGSYTTAIVEWPDGSVSSVSLDFIKFLRPANGH